MVLAYDSVLSSRRFLTHADPAIIAEQPCLTLCALFSLEHQCQHAERSQDNAPAASAPFTGPLADLGIAGLRACAQNAGLLTFKSAESEQTQTWIEDERRRLQPLPQAAPLALSACIGSVHQVADQNTPEGQVRESWCCRFR